MQARHINSAEDKALYQSIYKEIKEALNEDNGSAKRYFYLKLFVYGSAAIASYMLLFFISNPFLFILDFMLFGFIAVLLCFNFAHDFSHHAIFKKPFWDNIGFEFIYTMVGAHPEAWKERHTHSHHFAPNVEHFDTDLAITGIIRVLPNSTIKWYHKFQHIYAPFAYTTYSLYWVFIKDFVVLNTYKPKNKQQNLRYYSTFITLKIAYILYILIVPMLFSQQPAWLVIVAFLLMHMFQSLYTLFTFFITHHVEGAVYPIANKDGQINTSWFRNQIKSSNDFYPFSYLANFIFGGVNNHIAHHLFPHINHYHYPKVNAILYPRLKENGITPNVTTYFTGIKLHLKLLKARGQ